MRVVQKQDLSCEYSYADLEKKRQKEINKWMWIVLIGCLLFQMFPYCVALNLNNVFAGSDWAVWLNFDATFNSLTFTIGSIGAALAGPFIAKIFGKENISMRVVYIIGIIACTMGFTAFGINTALVNANNVSEIGGRVAVLYIFTFISQVGVMIFSGLGVNNLISKWWPPQKRGMALGIAFAGGSLGNIWMQQLVGVLSKQFGNEIHTLQDQAWFAAHPGIQPNCNWNSELGMYTVYYNFGGEQYVTYIILGIMGLVVGVIVAMIICRKPLPTLNVLDDKKFNNVAQQVNTMEVSPLQTKKYPLYWIFAVGYLILQMGTVHAAMNGVIIQNSTALHSSTSYADIMATGGTLFGVGCLIGNVGGGFVNDKMGPGKSILLAGAVQCVAIICLMLSVNTTGLVYLYFILAGLSVYVYTSTPAFTCGRLFGPRQSNNHMAIIGIFVAIGFAITNSISGAMIGKTDASNTQIMFGQTTYGNVQALGWFAFVCMAVGTAIVATVTLIMESKGIKGILEYSPTKYTHVIGKHQMGIKFSAKRILMAKKDYRKDNQKRISKINAKNANDINYQSIEDFQKAIVEVVKDKKLTIQQQEVLARIYFSKIIEQKVLFELTKPIQTDEVIEHLLTKKLVKKIELGKLAVVYTLSDDLTNSLASKTASLNAKYVTIAKSNSEIDEKLAKEDAKLAKKLQKLNVNLDKAKAITIDESKQAAIVTKADAKIKKLEDKKTKMLAKLQNADSWKKYQHEYELLEKICFYDNKKHSLQNKKDEKIMGVQKKMGIAQYVTNFSKDQQIEGHDLLNNYYNDKHGVIDSLITKQVNDTLDKKIAKYNAHLGKVNHKKEIIEKTLLQ